MSETQQSTAAGERSASITRDGPPAAASTCWFCGFPWRKGGASYAAKAGALVPGSGRAIVEVCSAECEQHI